MTQPPGAGAPAVATLEAPPALRACLFALAGARFAVDVRSAREVVLFDEITAVPLGGRHLVGVANLRGTVMPIVDIRALLDLPGQPGGSSVRALVLRAGPLQAAVVVDAVLGLEPFEEISPPEPLDPERSVPGRRRFAAGHVKWGAESVLLLDAPKILETLRPTSSAPGSGTAEE
jgi:purine-binding chemotaxis protein CheW